MLRALLPRFELPGDAPSGARWRATFWAFLAATVLFRAWFLTALPLSGDEAYYWEWSRHLAAGYYDHPGLGAYAIAACTWLLGAQSELAPSVAELREHFALVHEVERFPITVDGREVRAFFLVRCQGFDGLPPDF